MVTPLRVIVSLPKSMTALPSTSVMMSRSDAKFVMPENETSIVSPMSWPAEKSVMISAPKLDPKTKVSSPAPPVRVSLPAPPVIWFAAALPMMVSLPDPPMAFSITTPSAMLRVRVSLDAPDQ